MTESPAEAVARLLAKERQRRFEQEHRARCYAEVLAIYAHRLAVMQGIDPAKAIMRARAEVQERLKDKDI